MHDTETHVSVRASVCIRVCMCVHVCVRAWTRMHVCVRVCVLMGARVCLSAYVRAWTSVRVFTQAYVFVSACGAFVLRSHARIIVSICASTCARECVGSVSACVYTLTPGVHRTGAISNGVLFLPSKCKSSLPRCSCWIIVSSLLPTSPRATLSHSIR